MVMLSPTVPDVCFDKFPHHINMAVDKQSLMRCTFATSENTPIVIKQLALILRLNGHWIGEVGVNTPQSKHWQESPAADRLFSPQ